MEWEPNERDAWVADAQRWVTQIIGVKQCLINLNDQGEVEEVLVVAGTDKPPRRIVRDVETLLKARAQVDIDYKKISVTQLIDPQLDLEKTSVPPASAEAPVPGVTFHDTKDLFRLDSPGDEGGLPAPGHIPGDSDPSESFAEPTAKPLAEPVPAVVLAEQGAPRIVCNNVGLISSDMVVRAEVLLQAGEVEALGTVEGANHAGSDTILVARATVQALSELLNEPVLLHVREIRLENLGNQTVILAAIDLVEGRRSETLFGACSANHNRQQAVVHAVLDALNRRLGLYGFKSARSEA